MNLWLEKCCRLVIAFLWLVTGITSMWGAPEIGYEVLARGNIYGLYADACLLLGSVVDILLACWILLGIRIIYCGWAQILVITTYTLILTIIAPEFWLHPFGPLTKNLPILLFIYIVFIKHTRPLK
jgi:hypothetical protein